MKVAQSDEEYFESSDTGDEEEGFFEKGAIGKKC